MVLKKVMSVDAKTKEKRYTDVEMGADEPIRIEEKSDIQKVVEYAKSNGWI